MLSAYRSVLRRRDVLSALIPYVLARVPLSMAPLALMLLTRAETGSYHRVGVVCGSYALAVAIAGPMIGRLVDRRGQSRVLLVTGLVHPIGMVGAAYAAQRGWYPVLIVCAVVAAASLPPVAACMRVLWGRLLPDEDSRRAGFALEGVIVEVAELSGPLLITVLLVLGKPAIAVAMAGVIMGAAALAFRASSASRSVPPLPVPTDRLGPLGLRGVRRILVIIVASTATIGGVEVATTAYARHHGGLASAGLYIGLISVGGVIAGVLFGGSPWLGRYRGPNALALVLLLSAGAAAAIATASSAVLVLVSLFAFGASVAVGVVLQLGMMTDVTTEAVRTQAFTWGGTANFVGIGIGTALIGSMLDRFGTGTAFVVSAAPTVLAALFVLVSRSALAPVQVELTEETVEEPTIAEVEVTAAVPVPHPEVAALAAEVSELRAHLADVEAALRTALQNSPAGVLDDARERARRMLDRADSACLEIRERATDDADRVHGAATTAAIEVMAAAERDARAMLERARREADGIISRARRVADSAGPSRAVLTALPGLDEEEAAMGS